MTPRDDSTSDPMSSGTTIVVSFDDRVQAERAIRDLQDAGFTERQIGVVMRDGDANTDGLTDLTERSENSASASTVESAAKGAVGGGLVGGLIGLLTSLLLPGVGPIVAGGVLGSMLTGVGIGAAAGGIIGALVSLGVSEEDAKHFDERLRAGAVLLTVDAGPRTGEARRILLDSGADLGPAASRAQSRGREGELADRSIDAIPGDYIGNPPVAPRQTPGIDAFDRRRDVDAGYSDDLAAEPAETWRGEDRRVWVDPDYPGPERRRLVRA